MSFGVIKRALISVTNKTGIVEFAQVLESEFGVEIISTGGTARVLKEAGVKVIPIETYTGFPEMMDGRVKTLHPRVHGGLLCRRDNRDHIADAQAHDIGMIDLVCVNLYEFEKTVENPHVTFADAIEHIDIGGPSMLRSAAKNNDFVTVVSDPADYSAVLTEMRENGGATTRDTRRRLALKVFQTTAAYDGAIAAYLSGVITTEKEEGSEAAVESTEKFPRIFTIEATKEQDLRYGENPQQSAAFYRLPNASEHSLARAQQIQGKPLSYNNLLDTDAAWTAVREFSEPAVIILKHQNPCGSAVAENIVEAYDRAFSCDPTSAFGGIIAANREIPLEFVEHFADIQKQFVEVLIAPSYTAEARERLSKRKNLRVLATGGITHGGGLEVRTVDGGLLVQDLDLACEDAKTFSVPTKRQPTSDELDDLLFAWKVCKTVKSNAILVAKDRMGLGMGPGQPNRVDAALLACERAEQACARRGIAAAGLVAASDAFFPFRDNVDTLAAHGVTAIIQPGGSVRDEESIEACNEHGIAMVFTGVRHFRH
ncbi:bifunctional phosphoribosylaminoimidazolecarboxamide formyltransferase/IMP cyclohydrolase [Lancefieldella rimae]|uniref:bifunctional phosphoribosylaminoimidazolecarboxamide formyltransferase/IMP cyclohydrolase n=1 Tax=Lancefieldella rimae TaxID=1383 RepID=UPI0008A1FB18|nr:bifunctional phosphoribosylaminoimidazolecarboxamide formyltransferase/IMP cyclohydrolase [Lancefieldella rimae]MBF4804721.1 bifunctional phosphoribosylaminoimidazolecarboxamide formyltransferase/IMP cyclohydrolase [Lancefieldella rimae]OFR22512.1 bifunctional phosphoribosylaminoimidazolecarboxamide formyltransferase/inosine monophosphate cyclohydrolase [Atopobium sp. HMSC064B08]